MSKLNLAVAMFVGLAILLLMDGVDIIQRHGFDASWPGHARYHVTLSGLHLIAFAAIIAVAAVSGLRQRRRSAWTMLAIASTFGCAAWPVARLIAGDPPPGSVELVQAGALVAALVALGLSYKECFNRPEAA